MPKAHAYLYALGSILGVIGLLLCLLDLAIKAHTAPGTIGLLSLVDLRSPAIQAGIFFVMLSALHLFVGLRTDYADASVNKPQDLLDKDVM